MALTLNNFTGFETQGTEEAFSSSGIAFETTNQRSGEAALSLDAGDQYSLPLVANGATDAGTDYIIGFAIRMGDTSGTATNSTLISVSDSVGTIFLIANVSSGSNNYNIIDAAGGTIRTLTAPFTANQQHYVEIYFQHSATGTIEVFIDGVSQGEDTNQDLTDGGSITSAENLLLTAPTGVSSPVIYDDVYILSGATAATDRLGGSTVASMPEVFGYQAGDPPTTTSGTPTFGTWSEASDTPGSEEADETALEAAGASALTLTADCDDTSNARGLEGGPSSHPSYDVSGTIVGAKYIYNLKRSNGAGTSLRYLYGNTGGTPTSSADIEATLTTNYQPFEVVSEGAEVPTASEDFRIGISAGTDDTGGRSIYCADAWAMLLHVPAGGPTSQSVVATAIGVPALDRSIFKTLDAVALAVVALLLTVFKTLAATATGVATTSQFKIVLQAIDTVATGVAGVQRTVLGSLAATASGVVARGILLFKTLAPANQFARPDSDVSIGAWDDDGGGTSDIYQAIDEATKDEGDFIRSESSPVNSTCEIGLSNVSDPLAPDGHIMRGNWAKNAALGGTLTGVARLKQGAATIATQTEVGIGTGGTDWVLNLTGAEADSISDYTDLRVEFEADGSTRQLQVRWFEFETPHPDRLAAIGVPSHLITVFKFLAAITSGVATITPLKTVSQAIAATATGIATIQKTILKSLSAAALGVAALTLTVFKTVAAIATGIAASVEDFQGVTSQAINAVVVGVAAVQKTVFKTLAATATGIVARAIVRFKTIAAVSGGGGGAASSRQSFLPGYGYINEVGTEESFLPGYGYVKENQAAAGGGGNPATVQITALKGIAALASNATTLARTIFKTISATASGLAARTLLVLKTLAATATGVATAVGTEISGLTEQAINAVSVGVAAVQRTVFKTLAATSVGIVARTITALKTLAATAAGAPARLLTVFKFLDAVSTGIATVDPIKIVAQVIAAVSIGVATLQRTIFKILATTATGVAARLLLVFKTLAATAIGVATTAGVKQLTQQAIAAVAVGVAAVQRTVFKTLAATATGTAARAILVLKNVVATATGVAARALLVFKFLTSTATGIAAVDPIKIVTQVIAAVAIGVAILQRTVFKTIAATATGIAARALLVFKFLASTATGVANAVGSRLGAFQTKAVAAVAIGIAAVQKMPGITQAAIATAAGGDPHFNAVRLLAHLDNDPPIDKSNTGHTLTEGATWALDTTNQKFGAGCGDFDGSTTGEINIIDHADFDIGSSEHTIEIQVRPDGSFSAATEYVFVSQYGAAQKAWQLGYQPTNTIRFVYSTTGSNDFIIDRSWTPVVGQYDHIAVSRVGDTGRIFINGTQTGATFDLTGITIWNSTADLIIGGRDIASLQWVSQLDEFRFTMAGRYPSDFTAPTQAFNDGPSRVAIGITVFKLVRATAAGIAALVVTGISPLRETVAAVATGVLNIQRTIFKGVAGTATGVPQKIIGPVLAAVATGVAALVVARSILVAAIATGVPKLVRGLFSAIAATAIGVAAVVVTSIRPVRLAIVATATGVVDVGKLIFKFLDTVAIGLPTYFIKSILKPFVGHGGLGSEDGSGRWKRRGSTWRRRR